jgi:hypothetical protein
MTAPIAEDLGIAYNDEAWVLGTYSMVFAATRESSLTFPVGSRLILSIVRGTIGRPLPSPSDLYYRFHRYRRFLPGHFFHGELDRFLRPASYLGIVGCPHYSISYQHDR